MRFVRDEYPKVTQADLNRAAFRVGLKPQPRKRRVTILLDTGLVEYFKAKAGGSGYQTLINETLREAVSQEDLVGRLRHVIREELRQRPHRLDARSPSRPTAVKGAAMRD